MTRVSHVYSKTSATNQVPCKLGKQSESLRLSVCDKLKYKEFKASLMYGKVYQHPHAKY